MYRGRDRAGVPFLGGRNFIESIVYTLTYITFQHRLETGSEDLGFLVDELERQLCGLARAIPQVKKIYHSFVEETLREHFRDYPIPGLGPQCRVRPLLAEWIRENQDDLLGEKTLVHDPEAVLREVLNRVDNILYEAIMGTLYQAGVITHARG